MRLCHFENYRYSADLDFSLVAGSIEDGYAAITRALERTGGSIQGLRLTGDEPPRIAYFGPLGRERTLKLDLADDELVLNTERQRLLSRWPDLPKDASVHVYTLAEIAGEKLRCVLQRLQCLRQRGGGLGDLCQFFGLQVVEIGRASCRERV